MRRYCLCLPGILVLASTQPVQAQAVTPTHKTMEEVVVTVPKTDAVLSVTTDPKAPRQPIPAQDGADFLKTIPGFSVIRKGGSSGEALLRGMGGSRLAILLDGQEVLGGCGGRMDPPTAYVSPDSYDEVIVRKGPQSVLYGAGSPAGVVMFKRHLDRFAEPGWRFDGSLTQASFGRNDQMIDVRGGNPLFYAYGIATHSRSHDYKDGEGKAVHSRYKRWGVSAGLGLTPNEHTSLEVSLGRSDGEAAYADRGMDGSKFARENYQFKFEQRQLSSSVERLEMQVYESHIDHVMDNFSLRPVADVQKKSLGNPDRISRGARVATTLRLLENLNLVIGLDGKYDLHRGRGGLMYRQMKRNKDTLFRQFGTFAEASYEPEPTQRWIGGLRLDNHALKFFKGTAKRKLNSHLQSGFIRYEADTALAASAQTWYVGLGHSERFPDFWEFGRARCSCGSHMSKLSPEKNTQLDFGVLAAAANWSGSLSGFYGKVDDYLLIRWKPSKGVRNIDATIYGFEGEAVWRFSPGWSTTAALAWVHGRNDTDKKALAQQPPLEGRLGIDYRNQKLSLGSLVRLAARQKRVDPGSGGIAALDLNPSPGFAVLSLNAGWQFSRFLQLTAGVDNVFNRTYREHLSRSSSDIIGYDAPAGIRVNEPGRTLWLKARLQFD